MPALLFGSISTLADTSEMQREAFNQAFAQHGLDWTWGQAEYRDLLTGNGGAARIQQYAEARGEDVDATAVHQTKSKLFQEQLAATALVTRPGVADTIEAAHEAGWTVALVTTTSHANLTSLLDNLDDVDATDFDLVTDVDTVADPKPDPAVFLAALEELGEEAGDCVAIEDNLGGVRAATGAGIACVAFPNVNTAEHDFGSTRILDELVFTELAPLAGDR